MDAIRICIKACIYIYFVKLIPENIIGINTLPIYGPNNQLSMPKNWGAKWPSTLSLQQHVSFRHGKAMREFSIAWDCFFV